VARGIGLFIGAVVATLVAAEFLFRLLPVSTATLSGYYFDEDILTYPAHHEWRISTGWDLKNPQALRSNNLGFAADRDFHRAARALALIGDSYVEASMLAPEERPGAQLQAALGDQRVVFAMGTPGTALLDYAQRIRFASETLGVRDFVVWIEAGDARQSLCGSGNVVSRCLDRETLEPRVERRPPPSSWHRLARHSALAQYVFAQLKVDPNRLVDATFTRITPEATAKSTAADNRRSIAGTRTLPARSRRAVDAVVGQFLREIAPHRNGRLLIVVDGRRGARAAAGPDPLQLERQYLLAKLREAGLEVLDLEPLYARHAADSRLSLEVGPYDRHLNALGVRLVVGAIAGWIES
jgi:hypothetical protein